MKLDQPIPPLLAGRTVAVARDAAFCFIYPANLDVLRHLGAQLKFFSPLADEPVPDDTDAVWLPGGYPELHAGRLAANRGFLDGLRAAAARGTFVYGECGGFMALGRTLTDRAGAAHPMAGLLPVTTSFAEPRLQLGYRRLKLLEPTPLGVAGATFRGHEFHYASLVEGGAAAPLFEVADARGRPLGKLGARS